MTRTRRPVRPSLTPAAHRSAVGYARVSTEEQATGGVSMAAQEEAIRAYCRMRGLDLVELVLDPGVSAGKPLADRPGGVRVVELVTDGQVGAVVAYKLDRLFRDAADCLTVTGRWDRGAVGLHLVDLGGQAIDTTTAMGRFFLSVMAASAEMERNLIRERTRAAMQHKRTRGELVGAVPYGYRLATDGRTLEPDPGEAALVRLVGDLHRGGLSLRAIGAQLTARGIHPRTGGAWHPQKIANIARKAPTDEHPPVLRVR